MTCCGRNGKDIVGEFKDDGSVLVRDVCNEPKQSLVACVSMFSMGEDRRIIMNESD